mmetsp:Transcript_67653/g.190701  ORF Transcript_67653/g.190701 Transcript_67653/m.190701 type:complete len:342 (+) Transcript_67653:57-1082(+)
MVPASHVSMLKSLGLLPSSLPAADRSVSWALRRPSKPVPMVVCSLDIRPCSSFRLPGSHLMHKCWAAGYAPFSLPSTTEASSLLTLLCTTEASSLLASSSQLPRSSLACLGSADVAPNSSLFAAGRPSWNLWSAALAVRSAALRSLPRSRMRRSCSDLCGASGTSCGHLLGSGPWRSASIFCSWAVWSSERSLEFEAVTNFLSSTMFLTVAVFDPRSLRSRSRNLASSRSSDAGSSGPASPWLSASKMKSMLSMRLITSIPTSFRAWKASGLLRIWANSFLLIFWSPSSSRPSLSMISTILFFTKLTVMLSCSTADTPLTTSQITPISMFMTVSAAKRTKT